MLSHAAASINRTAFNAFEPFVNGAPPFAITS